MKNTCQIILNWDKGQAFSERMSAKLLSVEGYEKIDPQSPTGGPDGTKDIIAWKDDKKYVIGCYFPNGQKSFKKIKDKYKKDLQGIKKNNADGFVFITNQKIPPNERIKLTQLNNKETEIFHGERICGILDNPKGYGIRLEYLGIKLSKEEQISFLSSYIDLKEQYKELNETLNKIATKLNNGNNKSSNTEKIYLPSLPISGTKFSSRLSIEDILIIHRVIMQETQINNYNKFLGFRKVEVLISDKKNKKNKKFRIDNLGNPKTVIADIINLLKWWRDEYMRIIYSTEQDKIFAIAKFYKEFLFIHPFLDGNGRVARSIASIQYKDLLNKDVKFDSIDRKVYYEALQSAHKGNDQKLIDIFRALIKE